MERPWLSAGELGAGELPGLLSSLYRKLASGVLQLRDQEGTRLFWLEAGQVRALETQVEAEKLGQWLVDRGILEREELALTLLRQEDGELFGDILLRHGLVEADKLHDELVGRAAAVLSKLLTVPVTYEFRAGANADPRICIMDVTTGDLLLRATRCLSNLTFLERVIDQRAFVCPQGDALLREQKVHLTASEAFLLSRVNGTTTAEKLRHLVPLPYEEFVKALAGLLIAGLVELSQTPPQAPARPVLGRGEEPELLAEEAVVFEPHQAAEHQRVLKLAAEIDRQNYYRRLGLSPGATQDQIHERYRELTRMFHPDRALEPHLRALRSELAHIFNAVTDAYRALSDANQRARYDHFLKQAETPEEFEEEERCRKARMELGKAQKRQAKLLLKAGDYGGALPLLEQAVRFAPDAETLLLLARVELRNPMWGQRALSHLRMAVALDPQLTAAWLELARFWQKRKLLQNALSCVEKVLAYDPKNSEALELRRQLK